MPDVVSGEKPAVASAKGLVEIRHHRLTRAIREGDSYGLLLIVLVVLFLLISLDGKNPPARLVTTGFASLVLLVGLHTSHVRGRAFHVAIAAAILNLGAATVAAAWNLKAALFVSFGAAALLMFFTPIVVLRRIISHRVVAAETLLGAIGVYLMIGCTFAYLYALIGAVSPDSRSRNSPEVQAGGNLNRSRRPSHHGIATSRSA